MSFRVGIARVLFTCRFRDVIARSVDGEMRKEVARTVWLGEKARGENKVMDFVEGMDAKL